MKDQYAIDYLIKRAQRFGKVMRHELVQATGISPVYASQVTGDEERMRAHGLYRQGKGMSTDQIPDPTAFFADLDEASHHPLSERARIVGGNVPLWASEGIRDHALPDVIRPLCQTIEQGQSVLIEYVGLAAGEKRQIRRGEPIGFSCIQGRWHLRAWLYSSPTGKSEGWRDLVLGRILKVSEPRAIEDEAVARGWLHRLRAAESMAQYGDEVALNAWLVAAKLMPETRYLSPHPDLTDDQKEVIHQEFGLGPKGEKTLLEHEWFYMERQYIATSSEQRPPQHVLIYQNQKPI